MKYTAIFINTLSNGDYSTKFFISSHDKSMAWKDIDTQAPTGMRLLFIIPGEQHVYGQAGNPLTNVA